MAEIWVRLTPRAGRDEVRGERDGRVLARVSAPPANGRANEALCRLVAKLAHVGRGRVAIVRGARSRDKLLRVEGLDDAELREALGL
jgi:uncharacterized protein